MRACQLLLVGILLLGGAAAAQAQEITYNPTTIQFDVSADHTALQADGQPVVREYEFWVFVKDTGALMYTVSLGKPDPPVGSVTVTIENPAYLNTLPPGPVYYALVSAVGPSGRGTSDPSNWFAFGDPPPTGDPDPTPAVNLRLVLAQPGP